MPVLKNQGQAMIEYLVVFIFVSMISLGLVKGLNTFLTNSFGSIGIALTKQLKTGVCEKNCFFGGYTNN